MVISKNTSNDFFRYNKCNNRTRNRKKFTSFEIRAKMMKNQAFSKVKALKALSLFVNYPEKKNVFGGKEFEKKLCYDFLDLKSLKSS